ncbi:MAG: GTP-binding protein, partial [Acinetobacter baumannii]|nr:GTP-binding protein [Acinetobacter baumannii]
NQYSYPLFFIDARKTDHILLIVESLIASLEVNYNLTS